MKVKDAGCFPYHSMITVNKKSGKEKFATCTKCGGNWFYIDKYNSQHDGRLDSKCDPARQWNR